MDADDAADATGAHIAGLVLGEFHPRLKEAYLQVWALAHDRKLPFTAQMVAKGWLMKMSLVLEAHLIQCPPILARRRVI